MSGTPLPKAAKPVWAKQLTRLSCLALYVKFQFVYTTNRLKLTKGRYKGFWSSLLVKLDVCYRPKTGGDYSENVFSDTIWIKYIIVGMCIAKHISNALHIT